MSGKKKSSIKKLASKPAYGEHVLDYHHVQGKRDKQSQEPFAVFDSKDTNEVKKKNSYNGKCSGGDECSVASLASVNQASISCFSDLGSKYTELLKNSLEQNMNLGKDFINCKNIDDWQSFGRRVIEVNASNMLSFMMDASYLLQSAAAKAMESATHLADHHTDFFEK